MTDRTLKVIVSGMFQVGKTAIVYYFLKQSNSEPMPTMGTMNYFRPVEYNNIKFKIEYTDMKGDKNLVSIIPQQFRDQQIILLVFDLTNEKTFTELNEWYKSIKEIAPNAIYLVVGNKCDLEDQIVVDENAATKFAESINSTYFRVSATQGTNMSILDDYIKDKCETLPGVTKNTHVTKSADDKKSCC